MAHPHPPMHALVVTHTKRQLPLVYMRTECIMVWVGLGHSIQWFVWKVGLETNTDPAIAPTSACIGGCVLGSGVGQAELGSNTL